MCDTKSFSSHTCDANRLFRDLRKVFSVTASENDGPLIEVRRDQAVMADGIIVQILETSAQKAGAGKNYSMQQICTSSVTHKLVCATYSAKYDAQIDLRIIHDT